MKRKTKIRLWIVTIVLGVLMIPIGVGWIVYTVTQTGHYDSNAEFTDPNTHVTTHGGYVTDSPAPFLGFALSFAGGILITVGSLGLTFGWLSGSDDDDDTYTSTSAAYAQSVPTTRMGWGTDSPPGGS
jgi:zinc transporter ZupT